MRQVVQNYNIGELTLAEASAPIFQSGGVLVRSAFSLVSSGPQRMKMGQARMGLVAKAKARPDKAKQVVQCVRRSGWPRLTTRCASGWMRLRRWATVWPAWWRRSAAALINGNGWLPERSTRFAHQSGRGNDMSRWNAWAEQQLSQLTRGAKRQRVELFFRFLRLGPKSTVLDLGSEDGSFLSSFYPYPRNIVLADIQEEPMIEGVQKYGLKGYIKLQSDGTLPIEDSAFDAVWCNSVIEHVTVQRDLLSSLTTREFRERADDHQRRFAMEIGRVGRSYFVQTPYMHFPIEAHSWLPGFQYLPLSAHWRISRCLKRLWVKQWTPDYYLYNMRRFHDHFRDASRICIERCLGLPKSLIAVRCNLS